VILQAPGVSAVREGGKPLKGIAGITLQSAQGNQVVLRVASGTYQFTVRQ
jgi:hypothetical protein